MTAREGIRAAEASEQAADPAAAVAIVRFLLNNTRTRDPLLREALKLCTNSELIRWAIDVIDDEPLTKHSYSQDRRGQSTKVVQELTGDLSDLPQQARIFATAAGVILK